jgi:lauroyl/myristoyl acyltransferase
MWALRSVRARGLHAHALVAPHRPEDFAGQRVRFWYYSRRLRAITTALGRESIEISRLPRRILETLANGEQILALVDIAVDPQAALSEVQVLDRRALVPRGLLRLAAQKRIPVTLYLNGFRISDGMRTLEIRQLGVHDDAELLIKEVFTLLDQAIRRDPAAWHFWPSAAQFFGDTVA